MATLLPGATSFGYKLLKYLDIIQVRFGCDITCFCCPWACLSHWRFAVRNSPTPKNPCAAAASWSARATARTKSATCAANRLTFLSGATCGVPRSMSTAGATAGTSTTGRAGSTCQSRSGPTTSARASCCGSSASSATNSMASKPRLRVLAEAGNSARAKKEVPRRARHLTGRARRHPRLCPLLSFHPPNPSGHHIATSLTRVNTELPRPLNARTR